MLEILGVVSGALGTIFTSGGVGLIGLAIQRYFDHKKFEADVENKKDERSHEIQKMRVEGELIRIEAEGRVRVAVIEGEAQVNIAAEETQQASYSLEPKSYVEKVAFSSGQSWVMVYLEGLRGSIRPLLTIYLCGLTTYILFASLSYLQKEGMSVDPLFAQKIFEETVEAVIGLFVTVSTWWFGSRNRGKAPSLGK